MTTVFVVADSARAHAAAHDELVGAGWSGKLRDVTVETARDARDVVLAALHGESVFVRATAELSVVDDLVDDLALLGTVVVASESTVVDLPVETWRLLHALRAGRTVTEIARELHVSLRTANRRFDEAKLAFGVRSRGEMMHALAAPERIPAATQ